MKFRKNLKFSTSGVRGIVGESLTPLLTCSLAAAYGRYVGGGRVLVGRDTRPSGEMIENAVVAGLLSVGCQPLLLGVVPTPTVQVMIVESGANGGIVVTASHNPAEWNALKLIGAEGTFLTENEYAELSDIYNQEDFHFCGEELLRKVKYIANGFKIHQDKIFNSIDIEDIRKRRFKVAVDCCNGVGAVYSRGFLEALGCEVFTVFDRADGNFERIPEPLPENLDALCELVIREKCDIGFAQDPDGDRLSMVDNNGVALPTHYSLMMAAEHILSENPGTIVVNIQTTKNLEDIASSYGCGVEYAKVGEINVVRKMIEIGSEFGGEGNCGGVIWRRIHPGRDSFTTMALMLEMLSLCSESIAEIAATLDHYVNKSVKFYCSPFNSREIIRSLQERYSGEEQLTFDGLRINFEHGWVLVRQSNTEPVLRLTVENSSSELADQQLQRFTSEITELKNQLESEINV